MIGASEQGPTLLPFASTQRKAPEHLVGLAVLFQNIIAGAIVESPSLEAFIFKIQEFWELVILLWNLPQF